MDAKLVAALVDAGIPVLGGLYATLLGFRKVNCKAGDPKYEAWYGKWGRHLRWLGPCVAASGVLTFFLRRGA